MRKQALIPSTVLLILTLLTVISPQQSTALTSNGTATTNIQSTGSITYPGPGQILFSGYIWKPETQAYQVQDQTIGQSPENLWIDENGYLHLKIII